MKGRLALKSTANRNIVHTTHPKFDMKNNRAQNLSEASCKLCRFCGVEKGASGCSMTKLNDNCADFSSPTMVLAKARRTTRWERDGKSVQGEHKKQP